MRRWAFPLLLFVVTALAACLQLDLCDVFSGGTLVLRNIPKYVYSIDLHARTLEETGALWGYDPSLMAGQLTGGAFWLTSDYLPSVLCWLFGLSASSYLKAIFVLLFLLSPLMVYVSGRLLSMSRQESFVAGILVLFLDLFSVRMAFSVNGMFPYAFAATFVLPCGAFLFRLNRRKVRIVPTVIIAALAMTLLAMQNLSCGFLFGIVLADLWLIYRRRFFTLRGIAWSILVPLLPVAVLLPWLEPGMVFSAGAPEDMWVIYSFVRLEWQPFLSWTVFALYLQPLVVLILIAGVWQIVRCLREGGDAGKFVGGASAVVFLFVVLMLLAGRGPYIFSYRYLDWVLTAMCLPAGMFLWRAWLVRRRLPWRVGFGALVASVLLFSVAFSRDLTPPLEYTVDDNLALGETVAWLRTNTDGQGRILLEDTSNTESQPTGCNFTGALPALLPGREVISLTSLDTPGLIYGAFLSEGVLAWQPIEGYSDEELSAYLRRYNIRWLVVHHADTLARFERAETVMTKVGEAGPFRVYQSLASPSFFLAGSGRAVAHLNRIELRDLVPDETGKVVLSYHWYKSLKTEEGVGLKAEYSRWSPVGMIRIDDPPSSLTIVNDTRGAFPGFAESIPRYVRQLWARHEELGIRHDLPPGSGLQFH